MAKQPSVAGTHESERQVRIAAIRAQIAEGTYETPDKLSAAVDAFLSCARGDAAADDGQPPRRPR